MHGCRWWDVGEDKVPNSFRAITTIVRHILSQCISCLFLRYSRNPVGFLRFFSVAVCTRVKSLESLYVIWKQFVIWDLKSDLRLKVDLKIHTWLLNCDLCSYNWVLKEMGSILGPYCHCFHITVSYFDAFGKSNYMGGFTSVLLIVDCKRRPQYVLKIFV